MELIISIIILAISIFLCFFFSHKTTKLQEILIERNYELIAEKNANLALKEKLKGGLKGQYLFNPKIKQINVGISLNKKDYDTPMDKETARAVYKRLASKLGYEILHKFPGCRKEWSDKGINYYGVSFFIQED